MPEQLQSLLDRIQKDGVEKADAEAKRIVDAANAAAAEIIRKAEEAADALLKKAEKESETFEERGRRAVEQAARDVILSVGESINKAVATLIRKDVTAALTPEQVGDMLATLATSYLGGDNGEALVPEAQAETIRRHVFARLGEEAAKGLEIRGDKRVLAGFRLSLKNKQVQHDFTESAISEALCNLLRPNIAEIIREARQ